MLKKLIATLSALVFVFSISACKEEQKEEAETKQTVTESAKTETKEPTGASSEKPSETQTIPTAKPDDSTEKTTQRQTTTVQPTNREDYKTSLDKPDDFVLYNKGKIKKVSSDQISKATVQINICLNDTKIAVLKLAVSEDMIEKIKSENKAIELTYDEEQTYVMFQKTGGPNKYKFEKVLIPLDGQYEGAIFFSQNGVYMNGPLKPLNSEGNMRKIISILNNK